MWCLSCDIITLFRGMMRWSLQKTQHLSNPLWYIFPFSSLQLIRYLSLWQSQQLYLSPQSPPATLTIQSLLQSALMARSLTPVCWDIYVCVIVCGLILSGGKINVISQVFLTGSQNCKQTKSSVIHFTVWKEEQVQPLWWN